MKAKQLVSYHFILGRLENTKLHLVGSHSTHKVTSHEHKTIIASWGGLLMLKGSDMLEAGLLSTQESKISRI